MPSCWYWHDLMLPAVTGTVRPLPCCSPKGFTQNQPAVSPPRSRTFSYRMAGKPRTIRRGGFRTIASRRKANALSQCRFESILCVRFGDVMCGLALERHGLSVASVVCVYPTCPNELSDASQLDLAGGNFAGNSVCYWPRLCFKASVVLLGQHPVWIGV